MAIEPTESMNATLQKLLRAIAEVDEPRITACCAAEVVLQVPGARAVDFTRESRGVGELAAWAKSVHELCGATQFVLHRYFENGCEMMASGQIQIERLPRHFNSPCSIHVRFEAGLIASFQLLLDTYGLEKFRGEMD